MPSSPAEVSRESAMTVRCLAYDGINFSNNPAGSADCPRPVRNDLTPDTLSACFIELLPPPRGASKVLSGPNADAPIGTPSRGPAAVHAAGGANDRRRLNPLPKWRLQRVREFIEANIETRISLGELAQVAGVSRMYFAAQFREATGLRPHDYVIQRRITLARHFLARTDRPIVDIALSVGFPTQAHDAKIRLRAGGLAQKPR
jgi:AraC family transcriptional regulator